MISTLVVAAAVSMVVVVVVVVGSVVDSSVRLAVVGVGVVDECLR